MIAIRYNTSTLKVSGWCRDLAQFGNLQARDGEIVVQWDTDTPGPLWACLADPDTQTIILDPGWKPVDPVALHWARVMEMTPSAERPLTVTRTSQGYEYTIDCYVTEDLVDLYQGGELAVGDFVLVVFVDADRSQPLATQKVYKSW